MTCDPCDGWPCRWPDYSTRMRGAERRDPITMEDFTPSTLPIEIAPRFAHLLPSLRTDWHRWSHDLSWTLESGPEDAPSSLDIEVPYNYSGGSGPSWTSYGGDPGDPAECETGVAVFFEDGVYCEVCLLQAETEKVEAHIYENPPEPSYEDD